jgi:cell fate regulator YaaT (PSP1 superfamily)
MSLPSAGTILRAPTADDDAKNQHLKSRSQELFADSRDIARSLGLPMEIVDSEILLEGRHAFLHYLSRDRFDARSLLEQLSDRHSLLVRLHNLIEEETQDHFGCSSGVSRCGTGGCGACQGGNCSSCHHGNQEPGPTAERSRAPHRVPLA